mmetsp:Transcript_14004/g.29556  ORF Transcript_14004/g.29556 Transcript_14004/m.29556 type:complete len:207 (-) Transcript_14004:492-1112(-)
MHDMHDNPRVTQSLERRNALKQVPRFAPPALFGKGYRRVPREIERVDVGTVNHERLDEVLVRPVRSYVHGGALRLVCHVEQLVALDLGVHEKRLHRLLVVAVHGRVQTRRAVEVLVEEVGALVEEQVEDIDGAVEGGEEQRRVAVLVRPLEVGLVAVLEHEFEIGRVVELGKLVQRHLAHDVLDSQVGLGLDGLLDLRRVSNCASL